MSRTLVLLGLSMLAFLAGIFPGAMPDTNIAALPDRLAESIWIDTSP